MVAEEVRSGAEFSIIMFNLFTGFMGLGLLVGIAALGVIAARSVVERRQQIGMMRALGFQRGQVRLAFLMESSFVALLGIATGIALGFGLSGNILEQMAGDMPGGRLPGPVDHDRARRGHRLRRLSPDHVPARPPGVEGLPGGGAALRIVVLWRSPARHAVLRQIKPNQTRRKLMQAIVYTKYGPPDVLQLKDVEKPAPRDNEVLVKVHAASANPADWHLMRAEPFLARLANGLLKPKKHEARR